MSTREQQIEGVVECMYAIKRKFIMQSFAKSAKPGRHCHSAKDGESHITPSQWMALAVIMKKQKNISIKEIAKELGVTSSAATQLVDGLVDKGYLVRQGNALDRRTLSLSLSEKYKKKMGDMRAKSTKRLAAMFDVLTNKELAQYAAFNKKIVDNILKK